MVVVVLALAVGCVTFSFYVQLYLGIGRFYFGEISLYVPYSLK